MLQAWPVHVLKQGCGFCWTGKKLCSGDAGQSQLIYAFRLVALQHLTLLGRKIRFFLSNTLAIDLLFEVIWRDVSELSATEPQAFASRAVAFVSGLSHLPSIYGRGIFQISALSQV